MNKHILEKIYNAYCGDIAESEETARRISDLKTKLLNKLNDEESDLLNKFIESCEEENNYISYNSFKQGFRASIMLTVEAFN